MTTSGLWAGSAVGVVSAEFPINGALLQKPGIQNQRYGPPSGTAFRPLLKMKILAATFVFLGFLAMILSLILPYGAPQFAVLRWWPPAAGMSVAVFILACRCKPSTKIFAAISAAFVASAGLTMTVSDRNELFIAEADGVILHRYFGGHGLKAIQVRSSEGDFHRIEGIPESLWNSIQPGQHATKNRQSFELVVENQRVTLDHWAKVWKTQVRVDDRDIVDGKPSKAVQPPPP